jgi:hypothetical protein
MMAKRPKSPQQKKRLSLQKDRRPAHGENHKSSRKNVPRAKAMSKRSVRRHAAEIERTWSRLDEGNADSVELTLVTASRQKTTFRKWPDRSLVDAVRLKLDRRRRTKQNQSSSQVGSSPAKAGG